MLSAQPFSTPEMSAVFAAEAQIRRMLEFESALARTQASLGIIPSDAAEAITAACRFDGDAGEVVGTTSGAETPVIPLVRWLSQHAGADAARYVHWGVTSQDVIDTALVLQMRDGLTLLERGLLEVCDACVTLAETHRETLMAGRTLLQQATPITFGLKAARWLSMVTRQVTVLREHRHRSLVLQCGGASGTLAALGDNGLALAERVAAELQLPLPEMPWHAERDRVALVVAALGVTAGAMAKIANDIVLLAQTEVGEVVEGESQAQGRSSAMPQKHNPVNAIAALAASRLALAQVPVVLSGMAHEHERAAGAWQAEWVAIPSVFEFSAGAVSYVHRSLSSLTVNAERMRANLQLGGGSLMAESLAVILANHVGRIEGQRLAQQAVSRSRDGELTLQQAAADDAEIRALLSADDIARCLDPANYLGSTHALIDRALDGYRSVRGNAAS